MSTDGHENACHCLKFNDSKYDDCGCTLVVLFMLFSLYLYLFMGLDTTKGMF